ncbi:cation:proton antiporter [Shewanella psychrotolerans]|uniref:cation:proton antiporter n=1 Tax=Shewanella psychrotolerans TaxID=2864206 RepID=UPI001C656A26|nr:cation:proton antiporter [Shewanella psychrotolerans]QYK00933.1 cation:proton antiporter [Shewanella psychrotolerans]
MAIDNFVLSLCLILLFARLFGDLFQRIQLPSVVGEMLAGLLLGPTLLNWVTPHETLGVMAELGVILLLFSIGCETSIKHLYQAGSSAVGVAFIGILLPAIVVTVTAMLWLNQSGFTAIYLGCALTATSIGISIRVLAQAKQAQTREGHIILGAAVIDDIAGVILLSLLFNFASKDELSLLATGLLIIKIVSFLLLSPPLARGLLYIFRALRPTEHHTGYEAIVTMVLICLFAWLAHAFGAPALLGGFAVGLALSRQFVSPLNRYLKNPFPFTHRMEVASKPLVDVFTPIFFVYVGVSLDLSQIDASWSGFFILVTLAILAIAAKVAAGAFVEGCSRTKLIIGSAMVPRGEVGLVFAEMGLQMEIISSKLFTELVLVIAITTIAGPLLLKWALHSPHKAN